MAGFEEGAPDESFGSTRLAVHFVAAPNGDLRFPFSSNGRNGSVAGGVTD